VAFKAAHGDCNVPWGWAEDPSLASWVHNQRARKRKLDRGEPSGGMSAERAARLTALGFAWGPGELAGAPAPAEASQSDARDGASQSDAQHGAEEGTAARAQAAAAGAPV
jgi:hypothetical protein